MTGVQPGPNSFLFLSRTRPQMQLFISILWYKELFEQDNVFMCFSLSVQDATTQFDLKTVAMTCSSHDKGLCLIIKVMVLHKIYSS